MYLTFFTNSAPYQLTWEDILNNPYISNNNLPKLPAKKVTKEITEEYAKRLWEKKNTNLNILNMIATFADTIEDTKDHYTHFKIPKKSDPHKMRQIDAPDEALANVQEMYKNVIDNVLVFQAHKAAHAYVKERSVVTAMETHRKNNSKWYLQIDLKDFFNSIDGAWLKTMLMEVYPFPFVPEEHLDRIIKMSLLNGNLPQGSKLSPTLTNAVMVPIDYMLTEKLHNYNKHHYVYTRYADDITISCKEKFDPNEILCIIKDVFKEWKVPFRINDKKTRFGSTAGRNYHLGLIINKENKISAGHERNNKFKAMIFNFCTTGEEWSAHDIQKMLGIISYYKSFEPEFIKRTLNKYNNKFGIDIMTRAKELLI